MPCYRPIRAYKTAGGAITFHEGGDSGSALDLPCGRCIGCRIKRTQEWSMRCMHEAALHDSNVFVTLTYDENHHEQSLNYAHFQRFIRELRRTQATRFFVAGEYGEKTGRPHWHAILFGTRFNDTFPVGKDLYSSHELERLWPHGFASLGEVNKTTTAYVASYCIKKVTGPPAADHYTRFDPQTGEVVKIKPEFARMSLKPGIGARWYDKYIREVSYARDGLVIPGGMTIKTPRYYDKRLANKDKKQAIELETERQINALARQPDNTPERLKAKEIVAIAKQSQKQKKIQ